MQDKLLNFFNSVGFSDEDGDFSEASISKVILKKKEELFEVFIKKARTTKRRAVDLTLTLKQ